MDDDDGLPPLVERPDFPPFLQYTPFRDDDDDPDMPPLVHRPDDEESLHLISAPSIPPYFAFPPSDAFSFSSFSTIDSSPFFDAPLPPPPSSPFPDHFTSTFQLSLSPAPSDSVSPIPTPPPSSSAPSPYNFSSAGGAPVVRLRTREEDDDAPVSEGEQSATVTSHQPEHIPRPPNAFILFRASFIKSHVQGGTFPVGGVGTTSVTSAGPLPAATGTTGSHLSKLAGAVWHSLSPDQRRFWEERAEEALRAHREKYPEWRWVAGGGAGGNAQPGARKKGRIKPGTPRKRRVVPSSEEGEEKEIVVKKLEKAEKSAAAARRREKQKDEEASKRINMFADSIIVFDSSAQPNPPPASMERVAPPPEKDATIRRVARGRLPALNLVQDATNESTSDPLDKGPMVRPPLPHPASCVETSTAKDKADTPLTAMYKRSSSTPAAPRRSRRSTVDAPPIPKLPASAGIVTPSVDADVRTPSGSMMLPPTRATLTPRSPSRKDTRRRSPIGADANAPLPPSTGPVRVTHRRTVTAADLRGTSVRERGFTFPLNSMSTPPANGLGRRHSISVGPSVGSWVCMAGTVGCPTPGGSLCESCTSLLSGQTSTHIPTPPSYHSTTATDGLTSLEIPPHFTFPAPASIYTAAAHTTSTTAAAAPFHSPTAYPSSPVLGFPGSPSAFHDIASSSPFVYATPPSGEFAPLPPVSPVSPYHAGVSAFNGPYGFTNASRSRATSPTISERVSTYSALSDWAGEVDA